MSQNGISFPNRVYFVSRDSSEEPCRTSVIQVERNVTILKTARSPYRLGTGVSIVGCRSV